MILANREMAFDDYIGILRRHAWLIVIPTIVVPVLAYLVSLTLPSMYTSQALVLVEQQVVPDAFVKPVLNQELNERLAAMQEQVLSRSRLEPLIDKLGLYKDGSGKTSKEDMVDAFRKSIVVSSLKADPTHPNGIPGFNVSFTADNPRLAQQVCGEIVGMFMTENLKSRSERAQGTTEFLSGQLADAKRKLDEQDAKLADFKTRYINQLPGQEQANFSMLGTLNTQLDAATQAITQSQQQKTYVESMLAQQVATWKASQSGKMADPQELEKQRDAMLVRLTELEAKYTPDHPDVIKQKAALKQINEKIEAAGAGAGDDVKTTRSNVPEPREIQQLRISLRQADDTIRNKTADQERLQREIRNYQARIQLSPGIEEQYKRLTRDYQTAQQFYDDLLKSKNQSQLAADLERGAKGEQFRVLDPPTLPERPTSPNRLLITAGGLGAGLVCGMGFAFFMEIKDKSMRSEEDVEAMLKLPTLVAIPTIDEDESAQPAMSWRKKDKAVGTTVGV